MTAAQFDIVRLGAPPIELEILPAIGARIHRLRAWGRDLVRTPADPSVHLTDPFFWGGYTMAPWCNRLEARPVDVAGQTVDLSANFRDGTAIHGQVYDRPWQVLEPGRFGVSGGGDGWPWTYDVTLDIEVDQARVSLRWELRNRSTSAMPSGIGIHPWFVDADDVTIRADEVFDDNLATAPLPRPVDGPLDRRAGGPMPIGLDATWAGLGEPPVSVAWRDAGISLELRAEASQLVIVGASPADTAAIAIEAQTHAPQGLRRLLAGEPLPLTLIEPDGSLRLRLEMAFHRD